MFIEWRRHSAYLLHHLGSLSIQILCAWQLHKKNCKLILFGNYFTMYMYKNNDILHFKYIQLLFVNYISTKLNIFLKDDVKKILLILLILILTLGLWKNVFCSRDVKGSRLIYPKMCHFSILIIMN